MQFVGENSLADAAEKSSKASYRQLDGRIPVFFIIHVAPRIPMKNKTLRFGEGFHVLLSNERAQLAEMILVTGEVEGGSDNSHRGSDQWLFVVSGFGVAIVNGKRIPLKAGKVVLIEHGEKHEIKNTGRSLLKTVNIYVPPAYTSEGDLLPTGKP